MTFNLVQHKADSVQLGVDIGVRLEPNPNKLQLNYQISGKLENLILPKTNTQIKRTDNLWQDSCFEAFLKLKNSNEYIELNLSPFSAYNAYFFDAYRQDMREIEVNKISLNSFREGGKYVFNAEIELSQAYNFDAVSITAIIKLQTGETTHWAIKHSSEKPNFHLPASFIPVII